MTDIIVPAKNHIANNIVEMDTPSLENELRRVLSVTIENIAYLGTIWRELDRRGVDLSAYRQGLGRFLPMIAGGHLAPEAMIKFIGNITILRSIQTLPIEDQKRLAKGDKIEIADIDRSGKIVRRKIFARELTSGQAKIVFDYGRIRSAKEQENMLLEAISPTKRRERKKEPTARKYTVNVDPKAKTIRIGRMSFPTEIVIDALRKAELI